MRSSGYDPRAMGEMFVYGCIKKICRQHSEFLLTHPISSTRVSDAFNAADQLGDIGVRNSIDYRLIKGRLETDYEYLQ